MWEAAKTVCVYGTGDGSSGVTLVGEAPGEIEDDQGRPFVGPAGDWLNKALEAAGIPRQTLYTTNICKCRPPANRDPFADEIEACKQYLVAEIEEIQPKVIVMLGNAPLFALTGMKGGITKQRGKLLRPAKDVFVGDAQLIGSLHPAYVMRNPSDFPKLVADLKMAISMVKPIEEQAEAQGLPRHERILLYPGYTLSQLKAALEPLSFSKWLTCDLEWTDLSRKREDMTWPWTPGAALLCMGLGAPVKRFIRFETGEIVDEPCFLSVVFSWPLPGGGLEFLQQWEADHLEIYHNGLSDGIWKLYHKLAFPIAGETMGIPYLQDPEQPRGLESLAATKAKVPPTYKHGDVEWNSAHFGHVPTFLSEWEQLEHRNAADLFATWHLHEAEIAEVKEMPEPRRTDLIRIYKHEMLPLIPWLCKIAIRGAPMDLTEMESCIVEQRTKLEEIVLKTAETHKISTEAAQGILSSPQQLKKFLSGAFKLNLSSTNKQTISAIQASYPVLSDVRDYRHVSNKLLGTYLVPWYEMLAAQRDWIERYEDGAVHRIAWLHAIYGLWTATGRAYAHGENGGNIHQYPREPWMRHLITAPPGCKILSGDLSMVELRTLAWQANETHMLELLRSGIDLHATTAAFISVAFPQGIRTVREFWPRRDEFVQPLLAAIKAGDARAKEYRSRAKPVNFGMGYEQHPDGFIAYARSNFVDDDGNPIIFSPAEAQNAYASYHELYPGLQTYYNGPMEEAFRRGWLRTPFGRYCMHFKERPSATADSAQSPAADLLWLPFLQFCREITERKLPVLPFGVVHDSILAVVKEEAAEEAQEILRTAMERPRTEDLGLPFDEIPVPLVADVVLSDHWRG